MFNIILLILAIWTIPWKGYALWLASKRDESIWFIVILILNTIGILEIFYIFRITKKSWADIKEDWRSLLESFKKPEDTTPTTE
jgi:methionyl-tRNA synthetase